MTKDKTPKTNIEEMAGEIVSAFQDIEDSAHEVATDVYGEFETWLSGYLKDQARTECEKYLDEFNDWLSVDWVESAIITFNEKKRKEQRKHE